jgi:hypothetical protein
MTALSFSAILLPLLVGKRPRVPFLLAILILLCGSVLPCAAQNAALERGTAIIDPVALQELDRGSFGLGQMLRSVTGAAAIGNDELFALASMAPVRKALDDEFDRYIAKHRTAAPAEAIGIGPSFDLQLFDRALLYSPDTRFVLAGIVNRMDRAFVAPDACGEIRLIYRLTRIAPVAAGDIASPRLPMTLNMVLKARGDDNAATGCAEIARRWLAAGEAPSSGAELASWLTSKDGPLALVRPHNIDRIETDLQIAHVPKTARHEFRTDYLLKLFKLDPQRRAFVEAPLENQIDRDRILADAGLKVDFRTWLLEAKHIGELDRGTIVVPERFLAKGAIAATPAGFAPSSLQPAFGLVQADGYGNEVFGESEVVAALKKAAAHGVTFENIRSVAGFERRLNDITCTGCHQTRGIGGFHFPGVDWMASNPSNATVVPASPHFFGDQPRRRDILAAMSEGREPDFSRGFSDRPQSRGSTELAGTLYEDGWGAHCYQQRPKASDNDASFRLWTCAEGLSCQPVGSTSRFGMCFVKSR